MLWYDFNQFKKESKHFHQLLQLLNTDFVGTLAGFHTFWLSKKCYIYISAVCLFYLGFWLFEIFSAVLNWKLIGSKNITILVILIVEFGDNFNLQASHLLEFGQALEFTFQWKTSLIMKSNSTHAKDCAQFCSYRKQCNNNKTPPHILNSLGDLN